MSKPSSGLFSGTKGDSAFRGDAESIIAERVAGLDLREHAIPRKQLSAKARKTIAAKIKNRTATAKEYKHYMWDKRFSNRRRAGIKNFYAEERSRLLNGEKATRNWTAAQRKDILAKRTPSFNGKPIQAHHTYSASKYPHLANEGAVIYPATYTEHLKGWHGGSYKQSVPGKRMRPIQEF